MFVSVSNRKIHFSYSYSKSETRTCQRRQYNPFIPHVIKLNQFKTDYLEIKPIETTTARYIKYIDAIKSK